MKQPLEVPYYRIKIVIEELKDDGNIVEWEFFKVAQENSDQISFEIDTDYDEDPCGPVRKFLPGSARHFMSFKFDRLQMLRTSEDGDLYVVNITDKAKAGG